MQPLTSLSRARGPFPCSIRNVPVITLRSGVWLSLLNQDFPAGLISTPPVTGAAGDPRCGLITTGGLRVKPKKEPCATDQIHLCYGDIATFPLPTALTKSYKQSVTTTAVLQHHKLRPKWEHVTSLSTQPPFTNASASCSQITPPADSSWHLRCHSGHAHAEPVSPGGSRDQQRHALVLMGTPLSRLQLSLEGTVSIRRPAGWLLPSKPASPYGPVRRAPRTQPSDGLAVGEHPGAQAPALAGEGRVLGGRRG